jgi:ATP-dependent helicase HrpA
MSLKQLEQAIRLCAYRDQPALWQDYRRLARRISAAKPADQMRTRLQRAVDHALEVVELRRAGLPERRYDDSLPVNQERRTIRQLIEDNQVVIICGETGSGKTTQIPKICLDAGLGIRGRIGHTQPRRLAARSVAGRIAQEMDSQVGEHVGFKIRFQDQVSDSSYIKLMTDGILLAEIQSDRLLREYDALIIDEAHERSLNIDFLLGYLKTLLPRRPDLKLVITSATIDPQGFSRFFDDAPVLEVSGRSYPVETRYRPLISDDSDERDRDMLQGILHAVDELAGEPDRGDILIFVSGEREIRETAEALRKHHPPQVEILRLFSRLSAGEQDRVFKPHGKHRLIIATNVAETSLTVPGIRHVVDTGLARISRYSHRSKVQRLPIEPVSQASANQRKGRCGRTSPGICIRLYAEQDFEQRPLFTDPEIRRTNLASVILSMSHLELGDIESFPFINPPDTRVIRDGYRLLIELDALDDQQAVTALGRQLARLPVDPRLGRMLLAADQFNCLAEILIIVSALAVQDPRERPHEKHEQATQKHGLFRHERSDFLALLNIWQAFREQAKHLSQNKLRRWCHEHFLAWMRMREWRETHKQLHGQIKQMGYHPNATDATYEQVHRALLAGLLSHIGQRDENIEYRGPRQRVFRLAPDSALIKKPPRWLIAATLVETHRLYARTNAAIEPEWIEQAAGNRCQKQYWEPHWEQRRGQVVAYEQVSVLGLVVVPRRKVHYGPIDPPLSRELFIRGALVEGRYPSKAAFLTANRELIDKLERLEHKRRRRDVIDDEIIFRFYDERIPDRIYQAHSFERWLKTAQTEQPDLLYMQREALLEQVPELPEDQFPDHVSVAGNRLKLSYRFDPGHPLDGVTVHVPLHYLNTLSDHDFDWLVPGLVRDKLDFLLRGLPKHIRRKLVPIPETITWCLENRSASRCALTESLADCLKQRTGVRIAADAWPIDQLPAHLKMNYRLLDERGQELATGRNLSALRQAYADQAAEAFSDAPAWKIQRNNIERWDFGNLPMEVRQRHNKVEIVGYPALTVDEDGNLSIEVLDSPVQARHLHHAGLQALILKTLPEQARYLHKQLPGIDRQCLYFATLGDCQSLREDLIAAVLDECFLAGRTYPYHQDEFDRIIANGRVKVIDVTNRLCRLNLDSLQLYHTVSTALEELSEAQQQDSLNDMMMQLEYLVYPGYLQQAGMSQLRHYPRYLKALQARMQKMNDKPQREAQSLATVAPYMLRYTDRAADWDALDEAQRVQLENYHWLLEEFRVSLFAQELGTAQPVSTRRLDKLWAELS